MYIKIYPLHSLINNKIQNKDYKFRIWSAGCASGENHIQQLFC
ncbi:MAG: hypothetical protein K8R68_05195 [Bacteroidales bacterium]|nr:hypothetical protein [Bacteroidales bacterium]